MGVIGYHSNRSYKKTLVTGPQKLIYWYRAILSIPAENHKYQVYEQKVAKKSSLSSDLGTSGGKYEMAWDKGYYEEDDGAGNSHIEAMSISWIFGVGYIIMIVCPWSQSLLFFEHVAGRNSLLI
jgi:hypothetical protein